MKAKTIKSVLQKKHDEWLLSIKDDKVRELAKKNTIITGGCIASMLLREKVNDYDLYFRNLETVQAVTGYYVGEFNQLNPWIPKGEDGIKVPPAYWETDEETGRVRVVVKSAGIAGTSNRETYQYFEKQDTGSSAAADYVEDVAKILSEEDIEGIEKYRPVFLSANAISLSHKVQLVIRFYGEPDVIHENYDFVHCTNWWDSHKKHLELRKEALESLLTKELRYIGSKYPLCSIIRTRKFIARDWTINAGQYVKMAFHLQEFDLNDVEVLEEQLTGVDIHYFFEVIEALKKRDDKRVDNAYLLEVIDRIF